MKTFAIRRWSASVGSWQLSGRKDLLGEAIASVRVQHENAPNCDFEIIEVVETLVFELPCTHDELDHGICTSCTEDRNFNSHRYGKTIHEP